MKKEENAIIFHPGNFLWYFRHFDNRKSPRNSSGKPRNSDPTWFIKDENDMFLLSMYRLSNEKNSPVYGKKDVDIGDLFEFANMIKIDKYEITEPLNLLYLDEHYKLMHLAKKIKKVDPEFKYEIDDEIDDLADNIEIAEYLNIEELSEALGLENIDGWYQDQYGEVQSMVEIMLTSKGKKKISHVDTKTMENYLEG